MRAVILLACALVGCVLSQVPPTISETYKSDLTVHIQNGTHGFFGRGVEIRDQPAGKAVVQYIFNENGQSENVYVLERFDLGEQYTVQRDQKCLETKFAKNQTMPLQWAWLKNPNTKFVGHEHINGFNASVWELKIGYASISVALNGSSPLVYRRHTAERNLTVIYEHFDGKTPIDAKGRYFDVPSECQNTSVPVIPRSGCIAGATVIANAKVWVTEKVPYSQTSTHDGYRTDCSGYVSMAWELAKPGLVTSTMHTVAKPITKAQLKAGDVLLNAAEHVVLFGGWTDSSETHYTAYEETKPGEGTVSRPTPYPYWYETNLFLPYRYNNLC